MLIFEYKEELNVIHKRRNSQFNKSFHNNATS
jgi:hypothetical protein